jgi:hypothetical protein
MRKVIRNRMDFRASQFSAEGRARQFAYDLLAILDQRDSDVLAQAAALRDRPVKQQKPATPTSFVREVALGKIVMPALELGVAAERERVLAYRESMRDPGLLCDPDAVAKYNEFARQEKARFAEASELLKRGVDAGVVCAKLHLDEEDITSIREQLGM